MKRAAPEEVAGDGGSAPKRTPLSPSRAASNAPSVAAARPAQAAFKPPGFRPPGGVNAAFKSPFARPAGSAASAPARAAPPGTSAPLRRPFVGGAGYRPPVRHVPVPAPASAPPASDAPSASSGVPRSYFGALYAKRKAAKNRSSKTWLDGIVMSQPPVTTLYDDAGKLLSKAKAGTCVAGTTMEIGNWEVEIQDPVTEEAFLSGAALAGAASSAPAANPLAIAPPTSNTHRPFRPVTTTTTNAGPRSTGSGSGSGSVCVSAASADPRSIRDATRAGAVPLSSVGDAFPRGVAVAPVSVDPFLGALLRPHQREGVKFMYEATMGLRRSVHTGAPHSGCLLAHEMGTGKTLQVVALLWTLLKQGPAGTPAVRKAVIACPASLVGNWAAEIKKWLGAARLEPLVVEGGDKEAKRMFEDWSLPRQKRWTVLVTSFETLRANADVIASCTGGVDLLVCDEAHRLKNVRGDTQTVAALRRLRCDRRVLLTGTPIQNNLGEFFAVMDFACPGLLGDATQFRKIFSGPVERSRDKNATEEERRLGAARGEELARVTAAFVNRASAAEVNGKLLPPKTEYVVFCRLAPTQAALYAAFLRLSSTRGILGGGGGGGGGVAAAPLAALQHLQRLCNSATLLMRDADGKDERGAGAVASAVAGASEETRRLREELRARCRVPDGAPDPCDPTVPAHHPAMSAKLAVLTRLLRSTTRAGDRTVVVSGYTSTLDVVAAACAAAGAEKISRLDGSVPPAQRHRLVQSFNAGRGGDVFLLSCKAGGVGLNLIGANRLVLFDSDWNPANDLQALARVWREGQKKPVTIYRLLSTGTLEEKIFQRQILKGDVADAMGYAANAASGNANAAARGPNSFSKEELRDLFRYAPTTRCDTVDVLRRKGEGHARGETREVPEHWRACAGEAEGGLADAPLADAMRLTHETGVGDADETEGERVVSFVCELPKVTGAPAVTVQEEQEDEDAEGDGDGDGDGGSDGEDDA